MGRIIQATAPSGTWLPMKTVSPRRSVARTSCTEAASSASARMKSLPSLADTSSKPGLRCVASRKYVASVLRSKRLKPSRATR